MTAPNPHPLANPFNDRPFSNFHPGDGRSSYRSSGINKAQLTVPNQDIPLNGSPEWYEMQNRNNLTVPNQDVPPGDQLKGCGFLPGEDNIFRLSDGTLVDFKARRLIPKSGLRRSGYWGDPDRTISFDATDSFRQTPGEWRDDISIADLINNMDAYAGTAMPDGSFMDPKSAAYWAKAEEEADALRSSMTDEQKALIDDFERHFPKSKLIEESGKPVNR